MSVVDLYQQPSGTTLQERQLWSANLFTTKVFPLVGNVLFPGHRALIAVEGTSEQLASLLDRFGGVDYYVDMDGSLLPISARVQRDQGFRTVTLSDGQRRRLLGPRWAQGPQAFVHAYVDSDSGQLRAVAACTADALREALDDAVERATPGGSRFWALGPAVADVTILELDPLRLL